MLFFMQFPVFAENWVILGVFFYPALYYPLLACGTLHNKVGYVLGSLLSWTHFAVLVWQKVDCPRTTLVSKKELFTMSAFSGWRHQTGLSWSGVAMRRSRATYLRRTHGPGRGPVLPPASTLPSAWVANSPNNQSHCLLVLIGRLCHS